MEKAVLKCEIRTENHRILAILHFVAELKGRETNSPVDQQSPHSLTPAEYLPEKLSDPRCRICSDFLLFFPQRMVESVQRLLSHIVVEI